MKNGGKVNNVYTIVYRVYDKTETESVLVATYTQTVTVSFNAKNVILKPNAKATEKDYVWSSTIAEEYAKTLASQQPTETEENKTTEGNKKDDVQKQEK